MTDVEMETAVGIIRQGWADRIPTYAIERRVRRALPAITDEDLAEAFERVSDELVAEADEFQRSI